jgi:hypothetical protein
MRGHQNAFQNTGKISRYIVIPEAQFGNSTLPKPSRPLFIAIFLSSEGVLSPVKLNG